MSLESALEMHRNGQLESAEAAYRDAIKADPFDPEAHMALVLLLARAGKVNETRDAEQALLALSAPDERESRRRLIEQTLAASRQ